MSTAPALPPVSGQHRNRALAAARHARAVQLAADGLTYQEIADQLGYSNKGTVYRLVHRTLAKAQVDAVEDLQQLEGDRLDALQRTLWAKALEGDVAAVNAVLRTIAARCRLFGLTGLPQQEDAAPRTVVYPPRA